MKNKILTLVVFLLLGMSLSACNAASSEPLPRSMKGYELYSWEEKGEWRFTLITGTNRNKTLEEITSGENEATGDGWVNLKAVGVEKIKAVLSRIPAGEWVSWSHGNFVSMPGGSQFEFALPPEDVVNDIIALAEEQGLEFQVY